MTSLTLFPQTTRPATKQPRVVLACPDFENQAELIALLEQKSLTPILSPSLDETKYLLTQEGTALVICHATARDGRFRELLKAAARDGLKVPVIVCGDFYDPLLYLEAMELGAFDYFVYPYYRDGVEWIVGKALQNSMKQRRTSCQPDTAA